MCIGISGDGKIRRTKALSGPIAANVRLSKAIKKGVQERSNIDPIIMETIDKHRGCWDV